MIRRVIKQGHNTLTITLPSKWAKQMNIICGDEIELTNRDNGLFISKERKGEKLIVELDISDMNIPTVWKYFMAIYREGYDEVKINFDPNKSYDNPYKFFTTYGVDIKYQKHKGDLTPFELIQEISNRFIGFELVEHHKDYCVIKDLSEISSKEFDSSLRRIFFLIQQMGEEMLEAIRSEKTDILKHTHDIDINIDKFHDYCVRVLNKTRFNDYKKSNILFSTTFLLELVGDEFRNVAYHIMQDMEGKKLKTLLQLAELTGENFNKFYENFYTFDKKNIMELSKNDIQIHFYLPDLYKKKPGKKSELSDDELEIFNHFRRIGKYINALTELRVEMEF